MRKNGCERAVRLEKTGAAARQNGRGARSHTSLSHVFVAERLYGIKVRGS